MQKKKDYFGQVLPTFEKETKVTFSHSELFAHTSQVIDFLVETLFRDNTDNVIDDVKKNLVASVKKSGVCVFDLKQLFLNFHILQNPN